jgi:predicted TIM-barrel fold metal-dependent hydrolase
MITGFNPADMYAADHIRRVLLTFPGVFSGIGEFTIHKEFVSSKVAGDVASLQDPALDRILNFAGEVGLAVVLHSDIDVPFPRKGAAPMYLAQMKAVLRKHPKTTIIWAHTGVGRVIHPVEHHGQVLEEIMRDPAYKHIHFDISWDLVARYVVESELTTKSAADLINRYPDRFLFGTDEVSPRTPEQYFKVYGMYEPLWKRLTTEASEKVRKGNYDRIFDAARLRVRAWEQAHAARAGR